MLIIDYKVPLDFRNCKHLVIYLFLVRYILHTLCKFKYTCTNLIHLNRSMIVIVALAVVTYFYFFQCWKQLRSSLLASLMFII